MRRMIWTGLLAAVMVVPGYPALAQPSVQPPPGALPPPAPDAAVISPKVQEDGILLSLYAPNAREVLLEGDLLAPGTRIALTEGSDGVWAALTNPQAGTYRYLFVVDGTRLPDPRNTNVSEGRNNVQSLLHVPGIAAEDDGPGPHGAIASVLYKSPVFGTTRRMHVYTPPGYEIGEGEQLPVLYLLHGGGDSDESWSSVGRAGFILDNLINSGRAKPMIVVMPAGHAPVSSSQPSGRLPSAMTGNPTQDSFVRELLEGIIPAVEARYRVSRDRMSRSIAGLSMGGIQAANVGFTRPELFSDVGIFSSGWFPEMGSEFERLHGADLDRAARELRLTWFRWGRDDALVHDNATATLALLHAHGVPVDSAITEGAHDWPTWRRYLAELAPLLFR